MQEKVSACLIGCWCNSETNIACFTWVKKVKSVYEANGPFAGVNRPFSKMAAENSNKLKLAKIKT